MRAIVELKMGWRGRREEREGVESAQSIHARAWRGNVGPTIGEGRKRGERKLSVEGREGREGKGGQRMAKDGMSEGSRSEKGRDTIKGGSTLFRTRQALCRARAAGVMPVSLRL